MKNTQISSFQAVFSIMGTLVGAGFASGREILTFFGTGGVLQISLCSVFFILIFFAIWLLLSAGQKTPSLSLLNRQIFGKFDFVPNFLFLACYFVVSANMLAGSRSASTSLGGNWLFFALLFCIFIALGFGLTSILKSNAVLFPLLLAFLLAISTHFLHSNSFNFVPIPQKNRPFLSIANVFLYSGMNIATATAVILPLGARISPKKHFSVAAISTIAIAVLFLVLFFALLCLPESGQQVEMPLLHLSNSKVLQKVSLLLILVATTTTLLSCTYPLMQTASKKINNKWVCATTVLIPCILLSTFGFSNIITYLYPAMGVLGLFHLTATAINVFKNKRA